MKVCVLEGKEGIYSCNVYWIRADKPGISSVNTLIDVGRNPGLFFDMQEISQLPATSMVAQVILTHNHYDHTDNLPIIKEYCDPQVYAFSPYIKGIDHILKDGDILTVGDSPCHVIHAPGHTSDSVCLFCEKGGALFTGDNPIIIKPDDTHSQQYVDALHRMSLLPVKIIYPGHGEIVDTNAQQMLINAWQAAQRLSKEVPFPSAAAHDQVKTAQPAECQRGCEGPENQAAEAVGKKALHILVAEDDIISQNYVANMLKNLGHRPVIVNNGLEALEELQKELYDIILMDVEMPEMDGLQAAAAIRERERTHGGRIPIIAMTSYAIKGEVKRCLRAGMDGRMKKPVRLQELESFLAKYGAM